MFVTRVPDILDASPTSVMRIHFFPTLATMIKSFISSFAGSPETWRCIGEPKLKDREAARGAARTQLEKRQRVGKIETIREEWAPEADNEKRETRKEKIEPVRLARETRRSVG